MVSSKVKACVFLALLLFMGVFVVGCKTKQEKKNPWVNTSSLPGQTFASHYPSGQQSSNPKVLDLSKGRSGSSSNFGPGEVSFEFEDLR